MAQKSPFLPYAAYIMLGSLVYNRNYSNTEEEKQMADFNQILDAGDVDGGVINVVNEISMGSRLKVEWNRDLAVFQLDRVEPGIFAKPCNYGFIPQTLDEDGDELDVLIICDEPLQTGVYLEARIIGIMNFEDDGEMDHKVVVVPADDRHTGDAIKTLQDLPEQLLKQIEHHFNHYKDLKKPGSTKVLGWGDIDHAKATIKECIERWTSK
jgi:inorganic pyrophosphatase